MANILMDSYPALTKKNNWEIPSEEVVIPQATNQLGNFLAQKVAAAQPVKVEANPEFMQAIPQTAAPVTGVEPAVMQTPIVPVEPTSNALVAQQQGVLPTAPPMQTLEPSEHEKYWGNKVFGKIPLDQFVQMAGMLANSFNPDDPLGKQLSAMGGEAYKERMKREYEGPNKLLERRLKQEQLSGRVAGNEVRTNLNNFIENWPAEAERLKGLGYNDEAIRREYTKGVTRITAMGSGLKGAALEEKVTARQEGIDTRREGNAIREKGVDASAAARKETNRLREEELRRRITKDNTPKVTTPEKEDKTLIQVEDEYGNKVWKKRSEVKEGEVAQSKYTLPQITKFKTVLRNPKAGSAKIEDLSAAAEAVNYHGNEPTVFLPQATEKQFIGTSTKVPFTKDSIVIKEIKLPKNKQGQQIYTSHVRDLARKRGISFEDAAKEVIKFYGAK